MDDKRELLLKKNNQLRWERYSLFSELRTFQEAIRWANYYIHEWKLEEDDVIQRIKKNSFSQHNFDFKTTNEMFIFLQKNRKHYHIKVAENKHWKKLIKDQLSKLPKKS